MPDGHSEVVVFLLTISIVIMTDTMCLSFVSFYDRIISFRFHTCIYTCTVIKQAFIEQLMVLKKEPKSQQSHRKSKEQKS